MYYIPSEYSGATFIMEVKEAMYLLLFQPHICWELSSNSATPWQNLDRSLCCIPAIAAQLLLNSYCCCFNFFVIVVVGTSACISSLIIFRFLPRCSGRDSNLWGFSTAARRGYVRGWVSSMEGAWFSFIQHSQGSPLGQARQLRLQRRQK